MVLQGLTELVTDIGLAEVVCVCVCVCLVGISSVQLLSGHQLCNPMDCSTPGLSVHHQLLEPTQTHVHHVSDGKWAD